MTPKGADRWSEERTPRAQLLATLVLQVGPHMAAWFLATQNFCSQSAVSVRTPGPTGKLQGNGELVFLPLLLSAACNLHCARLSDYF